MDRKTRQVSLEIVIPLYNEEQMVNLLFESLCATLTPEMCYQYGVNKVSYILVDDGSGDNTAEMVTALIQQGLPATLIRLSRNFGHQSALSAGFDYSGADVVAVMDADLQDPPELILPMLARWREGFDVVYAQRRQRKESLVKRMGYFLFYRILWFLSEIPVPLDSGDFCLLDRKVVDAICSLPEKLRFIRGLRAWVGFRQTGIEYDRPARRQGSTKYNLGRLYALATDGIASSSTRALKLAQLFSALYLTLSALLSGWVVVQLLFPHFSSVPPVTLITFLLISSGNFFVCLCIYILGAYIGRGYLEAKGRPPYVVMEVVDTTKSKRS